jgi:hypothetical protein
MTAGRALIDGIRRVNRAPAILACTLLVTILTALPAALLLRETLRSHLGSSLAADQAASGVNYEWWTEFTAQSSGLGRTFTTTVIGFAAVLDNLSAFLDNETRPAAILWLAGVYLVVWLFLTGGIVDRFARNRPTRSHEFFTACGVYFVRFLRLAPVVAVTYYVLLAYVHPWLFDRLYDRLIRDVTVERTGFFLRLALYAVFGLLLVIINVIFDYAKVRAVVEDRRSMLGALGASFRFVRRHAGSVIALYGLAGLLFVAVLVIYAFVAPGAGSAGLQMWLGLLITQAYVLARLWVRLVFFASEAALFQGRLAHSGYVAAPSVRPLESPAAEQITGALRN